MQEKSFLHRSYQNMARCVRIKSKTVFTVILLLLMFESSGICQNTFYDRLADSAVSLTRQKVIYDPAYVRISYPNGDVAANRGVCTDVIIRAYRKLGIDLQKEVHHDMRSHFHRYPKIWSLSKPDKNMDHRRVPNLMTFFTRNGKVLPCTRHPGDYLPGSIVCWNLGGGVKHIGLISGIRSPDSSRYLIVHNIGQGQVLEDCLFRYPIIGHYRFEINK